MIRSKRSIISLLGAPPPTRKQHDIDHNRENDEHSLSAADLSSPDVEFLMKPYKRHDLQSKFSGMFPRSNAPAF